MNITIGMPHVAPTSALGFPGTWVESCPFRFKQGDSSTKNMTLSSILQQPLSPILLTPSTPTAYYKSTQTPDIPSSISSFVLKRRGTPSSPV
ncbi:hypothetical protein AZE42_06536 [Rhizopogon vesiculosus]|uniref:Uncharacterized protein n=1 Tax=Rhizopogon vesiculosus TaxID=180088 RepID=A0A1J8PVT1_9AGAM|nr:hypothetical protein AZE42_06536 [Rhizopogon vesiculosus]